MQIDDKPVIVEQTFKTSIETVWRAITEIDQMHQWFFDNIPAFKPEVGFETQFDVQSQGRIFRHLWKITEVIPNNKITYNWKYKGYPGDSFVRFELFKENNLTKIKLTTKIIESFPDEIPEFKRESCQTGWEYFIQKSLKEYLKEN